MPENNTKSVVRSISRIAGWLFAIIFSLVVLSVVALYIPFVQDLIIPKVLKGISSEQMSLSADKVRLSFPLSLEVDDFIMKQSTDTTVSVRHAELSVNPLALLIGKVDVTELNVADAKYSMGNPDSIIMLKAGVKNIRTSGLIKISPMTVDLDQTDIRGVKVDMSIRKDTIPDVKNDSTSTLEMIVNSTRINLVDVDYFMKMEGVIDSLKATISNASLTLATVDLSQQNVNANKLLVDSLSATYIYPLVKSETDTLSSETDSISTSSIPWTINAKEIEVKKSDALYALADAEPAPGLDLNYIKADNIQIKIDSFFNRGSEIRIPIRRISVNERSGLSLNLSGMFVMDSSAMSANNILLTTGYSNIRLDGKMGIGSFATDPELPVSVSLDAEISPEDVRLAYPTLRPLLANMPTTTILRANADANGSMKSLQVDTLNVALTGIASLESSGNFSNLNDFDNIGGNLSLSGRIRDGKRIKSTLVAAKMGENISVPDLSLRGRVTAKKGTFNTNLKAYTDSGTIALDGLINIKRQYYDAKIKTDRFPVSAFLPNLGLDRITVDASAKGSHFNPLDAGAEISADIALKTAVFRSKHYNDINLDAKVKQGQLDAHLNSPNKHADFDIIAQGTINPEPMDINLDADIRNIDLYALGFMANESFVKTRLKSHAVVNTKLMFIDATADINNLSARLDSATLISTDNINIIFKTDSLTKLNLTNGDLKLDFNSPNRLDTLTTRFGNAADTLMKNYYDRRANLPAVRNALPVFDVNISAGKNNILSSYLQTKKMGLRSVNLSAGRDSLINMKGKVVRFTTGNTRLDTITLDVMQIDKYLTFDAHLNNVPGNNDQFAHVEANGYIVNSKMGVFMRQTNSMGKIGYRFGTTAEIEDSIVRVSFVPYTPVIGYKNWTINSDNFISYDLVRRHVDANLAMKSDESSIHIFTNHNDSIDRQEDINIQIKDIKLDEWVSLNPFAPRISGDLNANISVGADFDQITGNGIIGLNEFYYGGKRVGTFDLDVDISASKSRKLQADVTLLVDSVKTITASGHLNDSTSANPFLLDFKMIHFPLHVVNPFLPPNTGSLKGTLNGQMDITGDMANPVFKGFIDFDSTSFYIDMLGSTLNFSDIKIPVDSNVVSFDKFAITAANKNPLLINGIVDMRSLSHPKLNLSLNAENMQLVNSRKAPKNADVYGKAFIDLDATAVGEFSDLNIDASLRLLGDTKVTYIIPDATNSLQSKSKADMVKFVNFNDTSEVAVADTVVTNLSNININALLTIEEGANINIDLEAGSKNRIKLEPSGTLDFSMSSLNPARLQGRIQLNGGSVSYTPPFMSEKIFNFNEGSYVSFNGAMLNPILNIHAVDNLKANVTQSGQDSRLVTFNILLGITGSLEQMNVSFDLSTNDDLTISNELASMSAEQRANQAMNLLLYNVYTGPGTKGNANIGGNALYSFLESQVNSWAANNIRGVDLSFGIDQYDQTTNGATSKTTSYSYRLSKSLFNDRFKIVVGGAYTDDNDPNQNVALNLINDISLEYLLNKNGTMIIKIFRKTGYESILEGEITQTGIGFVYKRKIDRLIDLFKPFRRKKAMILPNAKTESE